MGSPAARVSDQHICPMTSGTVPHVGGPVLPPGEPTVQIGSLPSARLGDPALCVGPMDLISSASRSVVIGSKAAARLSDHCQHGGTIITGCGTVLIGDLVAGTVFNPFLWNDYKDCGDPSFGSPEPSLPEGMTQLSTNCYAYAADSPFGHPYGDKPQPGVRAGAPMTGMTKKELARAAQADGMIPAGDPPVAKAGYNIVAGVVAPGQDYHWYRQDSDGTWSHKPGFCRASQTDASGHSITDPKSADRDYSSTGGPNYSEFAGYFYVPVGGLGVKSRSE